MELSNAVYSFLDNWREAGGLARPKCHLLTHMADEAPHVGNPRFYHVYSDEAFNMAVVNLARAAHIRNFEARVICKWLLSDEDE